MQITRISPIDDDERSWNAGEYEAGYHARREGASASMTATRSWRAGWADADMEFLTSGSLQRSTKGSELNGSTDELGWIEARNRIQ
jgi:hypothetical protein